MLKFGRLIDLDVLEAGADRTKEREGELSVMEIEKGHEKEMKKLMEEYETVKQEYSEVSCVSYYASLIFFHLAGYSCQYRISANNRFTD